MSLTPCMDGPRPWTPPETVKLDEDMFFGCVWEDSASLPGWFGTAMCGTKLFFGFDGTVKMIRRGWMSFDQGVSRKHRRIRSCGK
jgi:hypothetical protein